VPGFAWPLLFANASMARPAVSFPTRENDECSRGNASVTAGLAPYGELWHSCEKTSFAISRVGTLAASVDTSLAYRRIRRGFFSPHGTTGR